MSDVDTSAQADATAIDSADTDIQVDAAVKTDVKTDIKTEPYWKDDWRKQIAKDDDKYLKQLGRYASPEALADALRAAQKRISSGELKSTLPKDATPEEITAWRTENGIPETPDKYQIEGFDVTKLDEAGKAQYEGFLTQAHAANLKPEQVKAVVEYQAKYEQEKDQKQYDKDEQDRTAVVDKLNVEWGAGYRANINAIAGLLTTFPESVREAVKGARLEDGSLLFNNPDILKGFVAVALKDNPAATIAPSSGGDPLKNVEGRIKEIETVMEKDRKSYNKDEKMQAEYRDLIDARIKLSKRAA